MLAEEAGDDRHHSDPEKHMIIEPHRCPISARQCGDQIMVVCPQDANHDKAQRVDCKQCDELLECHCVIGEGEAVRNANFKDYYGDSDREHTVRKSFDPSVAGTEFERKASTGFPIAAHFTISVRVVPVGRGWAGSGEPLPAISIRAARADPIRAPVT